MTAVRRAGLGLLTVLLLAITAAGIGYALRQGTGTDIGAPAPSPRPVEATPSPVAQADAAPAVAPAPEVAPAPVETPAAVAPVRVALEPGKPILSKGDTGMRVRDLQARLAALAWYFGDVTGRYDEATVKAVRGFQRKREIPVTGYVDRRTMDRLHAMTGTPTRDQMGLHNKPGPLDPRCTSGRVLCVDKATRTLRWVVDGTVLKTLDVRFGSEYTPTREGAFSVTSKSRDHVSSLYDTSMPFAMFFSGGQAVHYSPDFAAVGYAGASHGCVNVRD